MSTTESNGLSIPTFMTQPLRIATAMRECLRQGYRPRDFVHDLGAGLVVGIVAIPLSMALAIATGVPPQHGLYTAIVAGIVVALFGGSRYQVSGPTAAFVVILAPIVARYGIGGLMLASLMAGIALIFLGATRMGRLIQFVPYPVTCGFTAGIAVVIATLQLRDFLGLTLPELPESFLGKAAAILHALPTTHVPDLIMGAASLALLFAVPRINKRIPAPLVVLPLAAIAAWLLPHVIPGVELKTINSMFSYSSGGTVLPGIPQLPPPLALPWSWPGASGTETMLSLNLIRELAPSAFAIAILAAIESLLSAVIADGITGSKHDPDAELMALGLGTVACTFLGGFAATGAIARTAANIRFGARSPIASVMHAITILVAVVAAAPLLGYLPMAALAALLMLVAWNMAEAKHFMYVVRIAPRGDVFVLLTCFALTVLFDMVVAVTAGMMLASVLFIRRMAEVSSVRLFDGAHHGDGAGYGDGIVVYEIAGPLFFGAAEKAMSSLSVVGGAIRAVVLDFRDIPAMDVTGLVNLESAVRKLVSKHIRVYLGGVQGQPRQILERARWAERGLAASIHVEFEAAIAAARAELENTSTPSGETPAAAAKLDIT